MPMRQGHSPVQSMWKKNKRLIKSKSKELTATNVRRKIEYSKVSCNAN